jgi:hypothetical protein
MNNPLMMKRTIAISGISLGLLLASMTAVQARPLKTWAQVIKEGGPQGKSWAVRSAYTLPSQFQDGYVYYNNVGANGVRAYIVRKGLSSYPAPLEKGLEELPSEEAEKYVKSGKAIFFQWNLGNSGLAAQKDPKIYRNGTTTCLRGDCLTAPYFSQPEIDRILQSKRPLT